MAIKIANLQRIADQLAQKEYIYKDLHLDFKPTSRIDTAYGKRVQGNDIEVDYDVQAIINSLKNLFNTKRGQRFLFPLYGLDLNQFLFEAVTEDNGQVIGEAIVQAIDKFEPRARLKTCNVVADPDNNQYDITIVISIPIFNTVRSINTILDTKQQTFIFTETSRNI